MSRLPHPARRAFSPSPSLLVVPLVMGLALGLACASDPPPEILGAGSELPKLEMQDQFEESHTVDAAVRLVLFSRDMEGGDAIKAALDETGPEALTQANAVYIADISGMPGMIARMFAIPKMRERPYPMLLDRDGTATAQLPSEPGKATLLYVHRGRITGVRHVDDAAKVVAALSP